MYKNCKFFFACIFDRRIVDEGINVFNGFLSKKNKGKSVKLIAKTPNNNLFHTFI